MNRMLAAILVLILTTGLLIPGCSSPSKPGDSAGSEPLDGKSPTAPVEGIQVGNLAPDFQLQNLDGQTVSLGNLRGKLVLINFWKTTCPSCVSERPYIQAVYEEWSDQGLVVLAINIGESRSQVENFMKSQRLSFPVLLDLKQDIAQKYNIRYIPTTFFIDKDGIIQDKVIGPFQNKAQIENRLSKIIP